MMWVVEYWIVHTEQWKRLLFPSRHSAKAAFDQQQISIDRPTVRWGRKTRSSTQVEEVRNWPENTK